MPFLSLPMSAGRMMSSRLKLKSLFALASSSTTRPSRIQIETSSPGASLPCGRLLVAGKYLLQDTRVRRLQWPLPALDITNCSEISSCLFFQIIIYRQSFNSFSPPDTLVVISEVFASGSIHFSVFSLTLNVLLFGRFRLC